MSIGPTLVRRRDETFFDTVGLERFIPSLGLVTDPVRRYSVFSANGAEGDPVYSLPNLGTAGGSIGVAAGDTAPTLGMRGSILALQTSGSASKRLFDAPADQLGTGPITIYGVACVGTASTEISSFLGWGATANTGIRVTTDGKLNATRGGQFGTSISVHSGLPWSVFVLVANGASSVLRKDSTEQNGTLGTSTVNALPFGLGGRSIQADFAEAGLFDYALTLAERDALVSRLRTQYGI